MNYLRNLDERSDDELEDLVDEVEDDDTAADARNLGRVRAAVQTITTPRNGGVCEGRPWTGGSRATRTNASIPKTALCSRHIAIEKTVFLRCEKGVAEGWTIKTKQPIVSLSGSLAKIEQGLTTLGLEAVFEVDTPGGLVNLFKSPDALSLTAIRAHEQQLSRLCKYDKQNLYYSRVYLENSIDISLQQRILSTVTSEDGGPTFWHILQRSLSGAETSKMIRAQKTINETKLTNVPGLDVGKFHEIVKPTLYMCERAGKLPLDVGPTVIRNHLGPQDIAYNATVMNYASAQAAISTAEDQYIVLLDEMDNLVNLYDSCADWEKVEMPRGAYMAGSRLNQQHKDERTCYKCKKTGHIHANCPELKNKSKKSEGKSDRKKSDEKKWYNENPENKTHMTRNGKEYYWCGTCNWGRAKWTDRHEPKDCPYKANTTRATETAAEDADGSGLLMMDLVESGFCAIAFS